ncbi:MAG: universal stress protein [Desulfatiglandales bacterium]
MLPIKKILCPTDFSEPSYKGVDTANELAAHHSAELILVSVVTPIPTISPPGVPATYHLGDYYDEMVGYANRSLQEIRQERISPDLAVRSFVLQGIAADEIVKKAENEQVDVIVIATHGWNGWQRFVFGSVAEKVLRLAACPVLTVPES